MSEHREDVVFTARMRRAFATALRQKRRAAGMSQEVLAFEAGFDRTYPSLLERALRQPTLVTLVRLAHALKCEPGELITAAVAEYLRLFGGGAQAGMVAPINGTSVKISDT